MVLTLKDLTVRYPKSHHNAVEDISFTVPEGSITAMIGPNGSGKSTVIKAILNLVPYSGSISVFGRGIDEAYSMIGFLPQRFGFDHTFPITAGEFIHLALSSCTDSPSQKLQAVHHSLKLVDAGKLFHQNLATLSGGQLQRVLLARALVHRPKLLILDEPEAGVDVGGEQTFYELLEALTQAHQLTVLIASHELDIVYAYADQVICINHTLVCRGRPEDVLDQKTFLKLFGRGLKFYGHQLENHHHHDH